MGVAELLRQTAGAQDVRVEAFDGSRAGPADAAVTVVFSSPRAITHILRAPGELGLARAYVGGDLDVRGDLHTALALLAGAEKIDWRARWAGVRAFGPLLAQPAPRPPEEVRLRGRRHTKRRDARAVAHHYDVSNRFYRLLLGPSMAYTCAVYPSLSSTLEEAQSNKFDLVCRKLGLRPGMRLLDVGCGWGGMVLHAARHYGVSALGVTLSRQQAEWAQRAIAEAGLGDLAQVRHLDYRDVREDAFDAISSIGLTEHIGKRQLPRYFASLYAKLRPTGRLLNHCIMRPTTTEPVWAGRGFINRYVFPDGELMGLGHIVSVMQNTGFEVRHEENLREHYALTLAAWSANLDTHWDAAVREAGEGKARVWRLYLAGSRLGFDTNHLQLHQVLGVRLDRSAHAAFPLRPDWDRAYASSAPSSSSSSSNTSGRTFSRNSPSSMPLTAMVPEAK